MGGADVTLHHVRQILWPDEAHGFCIFIIMAEVGDAFGVFNEGPLQGMGSQFPAVKNLGLKATGPRLKILEIFQERAKAGEDRHLSAEEVYKELVNLGEDGGLATVYRVLAQFASAGILTRRNFEHGTAVFELDDGHHHDHLICVMCGKVVEFVDEEVEKRQAEVAAKHGYELVDHSMALYGVCPECRKHKAEQK